MFLLQELEEQKAKLEQMLLEAQQEKERLKAAVTQEETINQPEVPVHDHDVISITPNLANEVGLQSNCQTYSIFLLSGFFNGYWKFYLLD